ncbi:hypothetical protein RZ76_06180 [Apilactobacillus kunkeei]|uniref:hypothetical protein n=1 Tax=Apilactobacillus kunkeei TaxID=148814 RepID=UPI0006CE98C3|nr:hypothetical protein [Apilactobacillus kunkeei]KPN83045.1 hypothetical protein RZ76_06180 [Apilactobacillus kunkeei]
MGFIIPLLVIVALYLLETYVLTDTKYFWVGGIIPLLFVAFAIYKMISRDNYSFHDFFNLIIFIAGIICIWIDGNNRHKKKNGIKKDK